MLLYRQPLFAALLSAALIQVITKPAAAQASPGRQSAQASIQYLKTVMDQFHNRFPVYDDVSSAGDHFFAYAKVPSDSAPVAINGSDVSNPHYGATAIRCDFAPTGEHPFGGYYFQNGLLGTGMTAPEPNFGDTPNAGINLTGATSLSFWVRGQSGGEQIEFFMGGVGRDAASGVPINPYPDSTPRCPIAGTRTTLTTNWRKVTIDLTGKDLSYVLGGFAWIADVAHNPSGAVFYLDDIQYDLGPAKLASRLNEPRFLKSFTTGPFQQQPLPVDNFDLALRNTAFTYDNAVALLAFLADGRSDSLRRARLIGDAFVYASTHDRSFTDGRLRSDYSAGDISLPPGWTPNGKSGAVPVSGYYDESVPGNPQFREIEQGAIDTGNNAWAMIALLGLYKRTGNPAYLNTAANIGHFIQTFRDDNPLDTYRAFREE